MQEVLIDTDILSNLMRRNATVLAHAEAYLAVHEKLSFSIITRYEIMRGLKAKGATVQTARFDKLCSQSRILSLNDAIVEAAACIYADLYKRGEIIGDADILIAATAHVHGLRLSTNNEGHFKRVKDLEMVNWMKA